MGRTQSAMAILTTMIQLFMSVGLGVIAEKISLLAGYTLLALLYVAATVFASRARQLLQ